jgi:hypothetical protein
MNTHRKADVGMPLDAVSHLNPGWRCWHEPTPPSSPYHAQRDGYQQLSAPTPEELHTKILIAESQTIHPAPRPADHPHSQ